MWRSCSVQEELWFFRTITKQSYADYLKGKPLDLFTNGERQTGAFNVIKYVQIYMSTEGLERVTQ